MKTFEEWMNEEIPTVYQRKRVMLRRYDTMDEHDEGIAKSAWEAAIESVSTQQPFEDLPATKEKEILDAIKQERAK